jgi:hypothetical protein
VMMIPTAVIRPHLSRWQEHWRVNRRPVGAERVDPVTVRCQECRVELAADSPTLRLELTCDDELLVYCDACWEREFGA